MSIFTLSLQHAFTETLAEWVMEKYYQEETGLSRVLLLLPSRRSLRTVREAFLRVSSGKALLLPQMQAIGDIDEKALLRFGGLGEEALDALQQFPPVIGEYERLLQLSQLVAKYSKQSPTAEQSLQLADELIALLDEVQREQADMDAFSTLAPDEFALQWQEVLQFLAIIREYWPQYLQEQGVVEPWQRRNTLLELLTQAWKQQPPQFPVIAAGTTGSIPATAALLKVIADLPEGSVVLPGLDQELSEECWEALEESHPQYGLKQLLAGMQVTRENVMPLRASQQEDTRAKWISVALQPAEKVENWQKLTLDVAAAIENMHYLPCTDIRQESQEIALLMREVLEQPEKTAALVTANRELARHVRSQLLRWGVTIDDSAGTPLDLLPGGNFLLLLLECALENYAPVSLLSLLKHPLARLGLPAAEIRAQVRAMEKKELRGIAAQTPQAEIFHRFTAVMEPLMQQALGDKNYRLTDLIDAHLKVAEALSQDENGSCLLWQGEAAQPLSELLAALRLAGESQTLPFRDYPGLLKFFLRRELFRSVWQGHPRLQILSPMEARMQGADRLILGGLNEGDWPKLSGGDPWLNRPMRKALGLPSPEREIGLAAHDFTLLAAAPEVFLTRAEKNGGAAMVPSRFLQRMQTVLSLMGGEWQDSFTQGWVTALDTPQSSLPTLAPPCPKPPLAVRPRELAVTAIEKLMRDPYSIYAQKILRLKPLDPLQQLPEGREFGEAVHKALELFALQNGMQARDPRALLLQKGKEAFQPLGTAFMVESLWWPRFVSIADWVLQQHWPERMLCEKKGTWEFRTAGGAFTVTARIDRMDWTAEGIALIDYKTGAPPTNREVEQGLANQLVLAGVMVGKGSFSQELQHRPVINLSYWQLSGGREGGKIHNVKPPKESSLQVIMEEAERELPKLLSLFDSPDYPYRSVPDWSVQPRYNDYEHLARIKEWAYASK